MSKKSDKQRKTNLILILLLFVLILGGFLLVNFGVIPQTGFIPGASLLSLDQVDLTSNFGALSGQVWVYTFRVGGLNQVAQGVVTPADASSKYSGDEIPEHNFEMTVDVESQECLYNIIPNTDLNVFSDAKFIEWFSFNCDYSASRMQQNDRCGSFDTWHTFNDFDTNNCNAVCLRQGTADVGRLESPDINTKYKIIVESQGQSFSQNFETLGASGETKGVVGSNTYIVWQGNLDTGKSCQDKDPFIPIYRSGQWQISSKEFYESWEGHFLTLSTVSNEQEAGNWIALNDVLANKALQQEELGDGIRDKFSLSNGKVYLSLQDAIQYPVITAYIKADWIGIKTPIGEPKILSVSADDIETRGFIKVEFQNIGDEIGSFEVVANCPHPFDSTDRIIRGLNPGETDIVYLEVTADVDQETIRTCEIRVVGTAKTDTKYLNIKTIAPEQYCTPSTKYCTFDKTGIEKCISTGLAFERVETCAISCDYDDYNQPYCTEDTPPPPPSDSCSPWINTQFLRIDNPFCKLREQLMYVSIAIGVLGFLFIFFMGYSKFIKPKNKKQKPDTVLTVILGFFSLIIGGIVYYLFQAFFSFLTSLIGIILTIIIIIGIILLRNIIPGR